MKNAVYVYFYYVMPVLEWAAIFIAYRYFMKRSAPMAATTQGFCGQCGTPQAGDAFCGGCGARAEVAA